MINSLRSWLSQVTTGHGVMILAGTFLSVLTGATSLASAAPLLAAGVIGLLWPENTTLQTAAQATATDVAGMVSAYANKAAALVSKPPV